MKILLPLLLVANLVGVERSAEDRSPSPIQETFCQRNKQKIVMASIVTIYSGACLAAIIYYYT